MKIPLCRNPLTTLILISLVFLSGCGGGGGHNPGNNPGAVNPDPGPGQGVDPALYVKCKGRVLVKQANGQTEGLPGVDMSAMYNGVYDDSAITDQNGVYQLRLRRGQENTVRATLAGYQFAPLSFLVSPARPEILPEVVGISLAAGQAPVGAVGTIIARLTGDPATNPLVDTYIDITDAVTGAQLMHFSINGRATASFRYPVGTQILITPRIQPNLRWVPASRTVQVTPNDQTIDFQWQAGQPPMPILRPGAQATPRPTPSSTFRPFPRPAATPRPTPASTFRPFPRPAATPRPTPTSTFKPFPRPPTAAPSPTPRLNRIPVSQP